MFEGARTRRTAIALVAMIALVAIMIPTVAMIDCDMGMGSGMPYMPQGVGIFNVCPGEWVVSSAPAGVLPTSISSVILVLGAMVLAAAVFFARQDCASVVVVENHGPPPPPEDPLGQRIRI